MSKGVTFYFVRHGETWFNRFNRMQGWANAPLTPEGEEDVRRSGRGLADIQFDAVYSSDLMRTIDTAELLLAENKHAEGLEIQPMEEFREVGFGYYEGLPASEIWPLAMEEVSLKYDLPVGSNDTISHLLNTFKELDPYHLAESYAEFWQRVERGLLILLNRHAGKDHHILVVCHGMTIRNLLHGLVADFDHVDPLDNASVSITRYQNGQFELLAYNQTNHFTDVVEEIIEDEE